MFPINLECLQITDILSSPLWFVWPSNLILLSTTNDIYISALRIGEPKSRISTRFEFSSFDRIIIHLCSKIILYVIMIFTLHSVIDFRHGTQLRSKRNGSSGGADTAVCLNSINAEGDDETVESLVKRFASKENITSSTYDKLRNLNNILFIMEMQWLKPTATSASCNRKVLWNSLTDLEDSHRSVIHGIINPSAISHLNWW